MRAYLPAYELVVPRTLADALSLLREGPGVWRPFAGGTDLMVLLEAGKLEHRRFFSIRHLSELRGVGEVDGEVRVGALTTYTDVRTVEGVADGERLHAVQRAMIECGGAQCGICTPGMVLAAVNLLKHHPDPTEADIREGLAGTLCRCTGYMKIFDAVVQAGKER